MPVQERIKRGRRLFRGPKRFPLAAVPFLLSGAMLALSFWLSARAQANPDFAEAVARRIYRPVSNGLSRVMGLLPFSLLEFGLIALALLLIVLIVVFIHKLVVLKDQRRAVVRRWLAGALCIFSAVFLVFTALCGVNYYRRPFSYYSGLELQPSGVDELEALCYRLAEEADILRPQLTEDDAGTVRVFADGYTVTAQNARVAMQGLTARFAVLEGYYPAPKAVFFSTFMSRMNLTGIYCPFTMEANVNVACSEYSVPATMCHELSHLRGFMREDEANFIAYLACIESDDPAFRYSAVTLALIHAGNQLYRVAPERYSALVQTYSDGIRRDFTANSRYWQQFEETVISTVSTKVNDTYLRANNQQDGVQSYGRMVDLLLALYRQTGDIVLPPIA